MPNCECREYGEESLFSTEGIHVDIVEGQTMFEQMIPPKDPIPSVWDGANTADQFLSTDVF